METLSELRDEVHRCFFHFDRDHASELLAALDAYIDARITVAIKRPVPLITQNVCPCVWENGRFVNLCAAHTMEFQQRMREPPRGEL